LTTAAATDGVERIEPEEPRGAPWGAGAFCPAIIEQFAKAPQAAARWITGERGSSRSGVP
jgi:hypothetical protein